MGGFGLRVAAAVRASMGSGCESGGWRVRTTVHNAVHVCCFSVICVSLPHGCCFLFRTRWFTLFILPAWEPHSQHQDVLPHPAF